MPKEAKKRSTPWFNHYGDPVNSYAQWMDERVRKHKREAKISKLSSRLSYVVEEYECVEEIGEVEMVTKTAKSTHERAMKLAIRIMSESRYLPTHMHSEVIVYARWMKDPTDTKFKHHQVLHLSSRDCMWKRTWIPEPKTCNATLDHLIEDNNNKLI